MSEWKVPFNDKGEMLTYRGYGKVTWHHPIYGLVKIKKRDFGLPRKPNKV